MKVGSKVIKNPATWVKTEGDGWGAGKGIGVVVGLGPEGLVDVRWPGGREMRPRQELRRLDLWVGARVVLSRDAIEAQLGHPRHRHRRGTIVGWGRSGPIVVWDGTSPSSKVAYHPGFLRRVHRDAHSAWG